MQLTIEQPESDKTDYLADVVRFFRERGVKTKEQLESRFDAIMVEYVLGHKGYSYDPIGHKLNIVS